MKAYLKKEIKRKRSNCQLSHCILNAALEVAGPITRKNNSVSCLILHMAIFRNIMDFLVLPTLHQLRAELHVCGILCQIQASRLLMIFNSITVIPIITSFNASK